MAPLMSPVDADAVSDRLDKLRSDLRCNYDGTIIFSSEGSRIDNDGPGLTLMRHPATMLDDFMESANEAGLSIDRKDVQFYASVYSDNSDDYMTTAKLKDGKIVMGD